MKSLDFVYVIFARNFCIELWFFLKFYSQFQFCIVTNFHYFSSFMHLFIVKFNINESLDRFRFVYSKRGTKLVYFQGNTFTPNDKKTEGRRDWKCSMYYKKNCRARLRTLTNKNNETTVTLIPEHSHPIVYDSQKSIDTLFNFK